jgi:hypothetical protein
MLDDVGSRDARHAGVIAKELELVERLLRADAGVDLLDTDDRRSGPPDDVENPVRVAPPISADSSMNVVAGNCNLLIATVRGHVSSLSGMQLDFMQALYQPAPARFRKLA